MSLFVCDFFFLSLHFSPLFNDKKNLKVEPYTRTNLKVRICNLTNSKEEYC